VADDRTKKRDKRERVAAGLLLLLGGKTLARARTASSRAKLPAVVTVRALLSEGRSMVPRLADAISVGRAEARRAARKALRAELVAAGVALEVAGDEGRADAHDAATAAIVAESLVTQWRGIASSLRDEDGDVPEKKLARAFEPRLDRVARSETAEAYGDEHRASVARLARRYPEETATLGKRWSALLDACERCWPHDGETVALDEEFSGGAVPGSVHPRCQCTEVLVERIED
jgi:hypothetical protein